VTLLTPSNRRVTPEADRFLWSVPKNLRNTVSETGPAQFVGAGINGN